MRFLDTKKSIIISSPAGSGKTEKLARRYIALLTDGVEVEKILAITFTEKAAAEMKERVLSILKKEQPALFEGIRTKIPLMRISTIHAFCLKLIKRFSIELGLDPGLDVSDELEASRLWVESVYEELISERESPSAFFHMLKGMGLRGWDSLFRALNEIHQKRPQIETALHRKVEDGKEKNILDIYGRCLSRYNKKKAERHLIDFEDLEVIAHEALSRGPEWHNILYAFDEHTDHILVDEFQDTSRLQWKIIDKLTEEWRSGMGAKREKGKTPTIFLVGDEKQSIYLFRGADAGVFREAGEKLSVWLGDDEFSFEEVRDNFRSLPAIVEFANRLFERLMAGEPELIEGWRTKYAPFEARRGEGRGDVELIVLEGGEGTKENRAKEAGALAKNITALAGNYEIYEEGKKRRCMFSDMAVLLRRRTHLASFEDAFRKAEIPFIVMKGIGFYDSPEVALLRELIFLLVDPHDEYSIFCLLRSPLFGIDYETLSGLFSRGKDNTPALEKLSINEKTKTAFDAIKGWIERAGEIPISILMEEALTERRGWAFFNERQRHANIKKFISLIEGYESQGLSAIEIREKLIRDRFEGEVPKANVSAEGMNAVRIMTIHAAKGLQFPMVFIPSLDEKHSPRTGPIVFDERSGLRYELEFAKRSGIAEFNLQKEKELEEEKRLFYVSVTRAMDFLSMTASVTEKAVKSGSSRLSYLNDVFHFIGEKYSPHELPFKLLREEDIEERLKNASRLRLAETSSFMDEPAYTEPIAYEPPLKWRDVTEDMDIRAKHGEDWIVLGSAMHRLFEELSKGIIGLEDIEERASFLLRDESLTPSEIKRLKATVLGDIEKLRAGGFLEEIILPGENSYAELPFNLEYGKSVFRGRLDRLIIKDKEALVYDYKTFPVKKNEMPELIEKYRFQMDIYKTAVERLFSLKTKAYLLFTHLPKLVEI
jgi:ATP-dependent helicase/nuclease subunit A